MIRDPEGTGRFSRLLRFLREVAFNFPHNGGRKNLFAKQLRTIFRQMTTVIGNQPSGLREYRTVLLAALSGIHEDRTVDFL